MTEESPHVGAGFPNVLRESGWIRGPLITIAVSLFWTVLANRSPDLTYHFAPLLAAMSWPIVLRTQGRRPFSEAALAAVGAFVLVGSFAVGLHLAGALEGPTFWDDGPSLVEAIGFAAIGSLFGARVASREKPGLLGALFQLR